MQTFKRKIFGEHRLHKDERQIYNHRKQLPGEFGSISKNMNQSFTFKEAPKPELVENFARLLLSNYKVKLLPLSDRGPLDEDELKEGYYAAVLLLSRQPTELALRDFTQCKLVVIEEHKGWMRNHPDNYLVPPGSWFDPIHPNGILEAEKRLLAIAS